MIGTPRGRRRSARSAARTHRRIAARGRTLWPAAHSSVGRRYRSRPPRRATHAGDRAVSGVDGNVSPFPRIHLRDGRTAQSADATAEEIATGFLEAFGAFDVDRATGYLADDAEISELLIGTASVEGAEEELRLNLSMLEAQGYEQQLGSCEETSTSVSGTGVRCPFEFHLFGSDEIGRGPYSGSYFDVTVLDGEVVRGSVTYEIEEFSPEMWEPFAEWVSTTYPDDAAVMYEDGSYTGVSISDASIGLLGAARPRVRRGSGGVINRSVEARRDLASYPVALGSR